jgi:hypothetical protein
VSRRVAVALAALAAVAACAARPARAPAEPDRAPACTWNVLRDAAPLGAKTVALDVRSSSDVWVAGAFEGAGTQSSRGLVQHWDGKTWRRLPFPDRGVVGNYVTGISALSPTKAWAVGNIGGEGGVTLRWDGRRWQRVRAPKPGSSALLLDVLALGPGTVWAVGGYVSPSDQTLGYALRWNGRRWTLVPGSSAGQESFLARLGAATRTAVWAVGSYIPLEELGKRRGFVLRSDGAGWRAPRRFRAPLEGVGASSAANAWAVGGVVARTAGDGWATVPYPGPGELRDVAVRSRRDVWAVGRAADGVLVTHWDGRRWTRVAVPPVFGRNAASRTAGLVRVRASGPQLWAVGFGDVGGRSAPVILRARCR